jgi:hypothetical protein
MTINNYFSKLNLSVIMIMRHNQYCYQHLLITLFIYCLLMIPLFLSSLSRLMLLYLRKLQLLLLINLLILSFLISNLRYLYKILFSYLSSNFKIKIIVQLINITFFLKPMSILIIFLIFVIQ